MTSSATRLARTFPILTARAAEGRTITYGEFAAKIGVLAQGTGPFLQPLLRWCRERGLPPLPIIVVNKASGEPSTGNYPPHRLAAETRAVLAYDWSTVAPPEPAELLNLRREASLFAP